MYGANYYGGEEYGGRNPFSQIVKIAKRLYTVLSNVSNKTIAMAGTAETVLVSMFGRKADKSIVTTGGAKTILTNQPNKEIL